MCDRNHLNLYVSTHDAESFDIETVHRNSTFIVDGGLFKTQNTHYDFFISGRTSTNSSDTRFSTGIPVNTGSPYGSEIPFSKNTMRLTVDYGSAYVPSTQFVLGFRLTLDLHMGLAFLSRLSFH